MRASRPQVSFSFSWSTLTNDSFTTRRTTTNRTIRLNGPGLSVVLCFNTHAGNAGTERDAVALRDKTAGEGPRIDTMIAR